MGLLTITGRVAPQAGVGAIKEGAAFPGGQATICMRKSMATWVLSLPVEASRSSMMTWQEYNPPGRVAVVFQVANPEAALMESSWPPADL